MKSYTDLEQSKKLVEILPLESANMHWKLGVIDTIVIDDNGDFRKYSSIPAWSLAELLDVLHNENMLVKTTDGEYYCLAKDVMTKHYDNPIDACYEMILKLHELKLL